METLLPHAHHARVMKLDRNRKFAIHIPEFVIASLEWKDFVVMPVSICIMDFPIWDVKVSEEFFF